MKNSFIIEQLFTIQKEYCEVLEIASDQIDSSDFNLVLDEISLFWFSKRDLIQLILRYISYDYECFLFTAASFLDVEDNEHYPFALFGEIRIIDDPLSKFTTIPDEIENMEFREKIAKEVKRALSDNLEIVSTMRSEFAILPITQMSDLENDIIQEGTEQAFWSLFDDKNMTFQKYKNEVLTIEQVKQSLRSSMIDNIVFSSNEDDNLSFEDRFRKYRNEVSPFDNTMSDPIAFFCIMHGFISQAFNTLLTCSQFSLTPYLRYRVSFKYSMLLGSVFSENDEMRDMLNRAAITHICYYNVDKKYLAGVNFEVFITHIRKLQINNDLNEIMVKRNLEEITYSLKDVMKDIEGILKKVYLCIEN